MSSHASALSRSEMASPVKALQLPWLARVAEVTWLAAGVLIPLAFDVRANQAFELPKLIVLTILAVLALTATSLGLLSLRSWEVRANVATLALVWLALVATASIRSGNIVESIWGSYERQSGLILAVALVGLGAGPWMYLRTEAQLRRLAWAIVLGSLPPLVYALVQRAGLDWIGWIGRPLGVTSTLGSSTALGGYVALSAALALAVVVSLSAADDRRPASLMRPLAISILLVQLAVLLLTSVRAALAGYVIGLLVTFLVATGRTTRPGRRNVAVITAALVLIAAGIVALSVLRGASADVDRATLPRADTSLTERLALWRTAQNYLASIAINRTDDLLLGSGPDRQASVLEPWLERSLTARLETTRFDRAHLSALDTVFTTGLLGLLTMVLLFGNSVRESIRQSAVHTATSGALLGGVAGGLVAFLTESSVSFPSVTSLALVALLIGAIWGISATGQSASSESPAPSWNPTLAIFAGILALILVLLMPSLSLRWAADRAHQRALAFAANENLQEAIRQEERAVRLSPAQDIYASQLAELLLGRAESAPRDENSRPTVLTTDPGVAALLQQAVSALEAVDGETPRDDPEPTNPFTIALHARALDQLLDAQGLSSPGARDNALAFAEQAARMTPARVSLKDSAARIALLNGEPTSALLLYNEAALLDPIQPQRMAEIGHAYRAQGSLAEAQRWYEDALRRDEETAEAWWGLAQLLVGRGDWSGALDPASRAARYQMRDWRFRRDLGRVYRQLGDMTSARQELRAAARLCPSWHWPALSAEANALGPGS